MDEDEAPTLKAIHIAHVLVVGGTDRVIAAVAKAAHAVQLLLVECSAAEAMTVAAQMQPLVIAVPEPLYARSSARFDALARDVRGRILVVSEEDVSVAHLETNLRALMREAARERPNTGRPY
ncbi:MAG: hypothetical protein EXR75_08895 [Myxococcales bacterium]|nr:hypothetical protein [Myxococcales bacterium]